MNELFERASAIAKLLGEASSRVAVDVTDAAMGCCRDLVDAGEPKLALDLIGQLERLEPVLADWDLRLSVLRVLALRVAGEYREGLALAATSRERFADLLVMCQNEGWLLRISEAACLWQLNRGDEAVERLMAIRSELIGRPDSLILARCMLELSSAEIFRGRLDEGRAHTLEAIVSARRCAGRYIESVALGNLARIEKFLCRWAGASEALREALRINETDGHRAQALITRQLWAVVEWKQGYLDKALDLASLCQRDSKALGHEVHDWYATLIVGLASLHRGDFDGARHLFGEGTSRDVPHPESRRALLTSEYIGDTYLEQGDARTALSRYEAVWPLAVALVPKGDIVAELRRRRAEAFLALGRHEEAYAEAKEALAHCRELGDRYEEAATYRTLAQSAAVLGKQVEAKTWFDQAYQYQSGARARRTRRSRAPWTPVSVPQSRSGSPPRESLPAAA